MKKNRKSREGHVRVLGGLLGYGREAKRSVEGRVRVPGGLLG